MWRVREEEIRFLIFKNLNFSDKGSAGLGFEKILTLFTVQIFVFKEINTEFLTKNCLLFFFGLIGKQFSKSISPLIL